MEVYINEIKNNDKVVKYLDIPLQHVSDNILKAMNRKSTYEKICKLFDKLKAQISGIALRTTFILGFPGETDNDFDMIIEFLKKYKMENVGFFKYSREEGTRAYNFENQIPEDVKESRLEIASQVQFEIQDQIHDKLIGQVVDVVIDDSTSEYSVGRYYGQCPQIDGNVIINKPLNVGEYYNVKISQKSDYDLIGELV